ncbi:MAG: molybdate ABC transporter substrate-binding protein, partial [Planctomycetota bacterium]
FVAASAAPVVEEIAAELERATGTRISVHAASSATLARQIRTGSRVDLFWSAHPEWIDAARPPGRAESEFPQARTDLLTNRLVLVRPRSEQPGPRGVDLPTVIEGRWAIGDPAHVPLGRYAEEALRAHGWWDDLQGRRLTAMDARATARLVEEGHATAGVIYASDVQGNDRLEVLLAFPLESHSPIVYPLVLLSDRPAARTVYDRLRTPTVAERLRTAGFSLIPRSEPKEDR